MNEKMNEWMDRWMDGGSEEKRRRVGRSRDAHVNKKKIKAFPNRRSKSSNLRWVKETAGLQTYIDNVWS